MIDTHPDRFESEHRAYHAADTTESDYSLLCVECEHRIRRFDDPYCSDACKAAAVRSQHFSEIERKYAGGYGNQYEEILQSCTQAENAINNLCGESVKPLQELANRIIAEGTTLPVPTISMYDAWAALGDWLTLIEGGAHV